MKELLTRKIALLAAVAIPLSSPDGWQDLKFSKIPANTKTFSAAGLEVAVDKSSSPLIYPLADPVLVKAFRAEIEIEGALPPGDGKFPEDFYLRMGLVVPGKRTLNFAERMVAAAWVKKLFSLAPKGGGVDKIYFFNLGARPDLVGQSRTFPGSKELMLEKVIAARKTGEKTVTLEHQLPEPLRTAALWLSIDGDDTKSSYKLKIKNLKLETAD